MAIKYARAKKGGVFMYEFFHDFMNDKDTFVVTLLLSPLALIVIALIFVFVVAWFKGEFNEEKTVSKGREHK